MTPSSTFAAFDGEGYELVMGRWRRQLATQFLAFSGLGDGERVLAVGCGTGALSAAVTARDPNASIEGIDFSNAYIDHATAHTSDPRIKFQVGNACAMPFADASFDRVLALLLLHFVPEPHRAIAEMVRVAKPGATVAATVWDARGGFTPNRIFWDTAAVLDPAADARRARNYTRPMTRPGELGAAWRSAGFTAVTEDTLMMRMTFAGFDDFWAPYLGREGPGAEYVATLDTADRTRLRDAVRRAYLDGEPDGPRSYAAIAWAVKGVKPPAS